MAEKDTSVVCIICKKLDNRVAISPKNLDSWSVLYKAALKRNFKPILNISLATEGDLQFIKYHRECRASFTHPKNLATLEKNYPSDVSLAGPSTSQSTFREQFTREISQSRVYKKNCIFCNKDSKYLKGSKTRENLTQAVELRADHTLRQLAQERCDSKILSATARDIVAAEAHYHRSCYINYTRKRPCKQKLNDPYKKIENYAYQQLFNYIRSEMFGCQKVFTRKELLSKLCSYFPEDVEIVESTATNFRYNLEKEFGDAIIFKLINKTSYILPDSLTFDVLFQKYVEIQQKLEKVMANVEDSEILKVAYKIREDVLRTPQNIVWPPCPSEMTFDSIKAPSSLEQFLEPLLKGSNLHKYSLSWSISQDIMYAISHGKILTPKHVLLPMTIKSLTGNVELISILNRMGHCCSYSKLLEIETSLCLKKLKNVSNNDVPLPASIHSGVPTVVAFDNIDRNEETLSGMGTSHRVNGIIIQKISHSCLPPTSAVSFENTKQRSIPIVDSSLPDYITGKRSNPPVIITSELPNNNFQLSKCKNLCWVISRNCNSNNQIVSSWTGFNIMIRDTINISSNTLQYLPTINSPATELSTVYEILRRCNEIKESLHLDKIVGVFDQAIYSKAMEIKWCHSEVFKDVFLMMGGFHIICNLLSIIGKLFRDWGLRDLAVESGLIVEGSINQVLEGKQYNRGVRLHKCLYEALLRILWRKFLDKNSENTRVTEMNELCSSFSNNICNDHFITLVQNEKVNYVFKLFEEFINTFKEGGSSLSIFWMFYIDLVEILLGIIRANRESDWSLYIFCLQEMIPWCFALDKINYARFLSVHLGELSCLEKTDPTVFHQLSSGEFSVQLKSNNPFAKIPIDQAVEETVNKHTQTAGGTKGFSLKPAAISKYYLTAEYRASALEKIRQFSEFTKHRQFFHPDLQTTRMKKDEEHVSSLIELLENEWTNPFDTNQSNIVQLCTGIEASSQVQKDLLCAKEKGDKAYQEFKCQRLEKGKDFFTPIKKIKLNTTLNVKQIKSKTTKKEIILRADRNLFANIILIAENRHMNMQEIFKYPLGPLPWSLANPDGSLKKTNKSVLAHFLQNKVEPVGQITGDSAMVIDAMAVVHQIHAENHTFEEISDLLLQRILNIGQFCTRIDVVFDIYRKNSIKLFERINRGDEGISFHEIKSGHKARNWKQILKNNESKNLLTKFLAASWQQENKRQKLNNKLLFVTLEQKCFKISSETVEEVPELMSSQEEADTRMMLHIKNASQHFANVICNSDDTDVLILCAYASLFIKNDSHIYVKRRYKNTVRLVDIRKLVSTVGSETVSALPSIHAITGCDSVSAMAGIGKLKPLKLLLSDNEFKKLFSSIGQDWNIDTIIANQIQKFISVLYCKSTELEDINEVRYHLFRSKQGMIDSAQLPPCYDSLYQHALRANYQAAIWKRCLQNFPEIPEPSDGYGWTTDSSGNLIISWMTVLPAPEAVLDLLYCVCARCCVFPTCSCVINKLKCTPACKLQTCNNMSEDTEECIEDIQEDEYEYTESSDED